MIRQLVLAALVAMPVSARALSQDEILQAALLGGWQMDSGHHMAAVSFALAPGWKTYWRRPGEAGIPPVFDWAGSRNVKSVRIHWPSPVVFESYGMRTVGYDGGLVLPLEVVPQDPGQPVHLAARVDMGVCREVCLPATVELSADLAVPGQDDAAIRTALKAGPESAGQAGLAGLSCAVEPLADGLRVTARMELPVRGKVETVIFEPADASIWVAEAETRREGRTLISMTELVPSQGAPFALDRSALRLTVLGDGRAVEITGCPAP